MPVCGRIRCFNRDDQDPCCLHARIADYADDVPFAEYIKHAFSGIHIDRGGDRDKELRIAVPRQHRLEDVEALLNILRSSVSIVDSANESHALGMYSYKDLNRRSRLGELVYEAKYKHDAGSTQILAKCCTEWLTAHPRYRGAHCVAAIPPSGPNNGLDLPAILAEEISRSPQVERVRMTSEPRAPQKGLEPSDAHRNVAGKFRVNGDLDGRTVLLLDDIYDSGATIGEGVRALRAARADVVLALTASKTSAPCEGLFAYQSSWEDEASA